MLPLTYTIHCRELPQRTAAAERHFAEVGVPTRWWAAPHGTTWGLATTNPFDPGKFISPGHVSLLLAHWTLWGHLTHVLPADNSVAMICEDDCLFPPDFRDRYRGVTAELTADFPDWQFVFLGMAERDDPGVWNKITERVGSPAGRLCKISWPWGTHCYLVRKSALVTMQTVFPPASRNMDQQLYQRVLAPNHVRWCAVLPSLVQQRTYDYVGSGTPEWAPSTVTMCDGPLDGMKHAFIDGPPGINTPTVITPGTGVTYEQAMGKLLESGLTLPSNAGKQPPQRPAEQSPEVIAATMRLTEPFPCIYRGEPSEPVVAFGRVVPTWECALLNRPCHQRAGLTVANNDPVACRGCPRRLEMGATGSARDRLPVPDGHFNPSMILWRGRLILATRDSWGHSRVGLWELTNAAADWSGAWSVRPIGSYASGHAAAPRLEDPRLYIAPHPETGADALHASFSMPDGYPPKLVRVGYVRFADDLSGIDHAEVFQSPYNNAYEKNWVPLVIGGRTNWVYNSKPHHTVFGSGRYGVDDDIWQSRNDFAWTGGVVRGGAPPVLHNGVYYHFFHGCLKRPHGNVYSVGCLTFDATPPFRVLRQTPTPLIWPDLPGPGESVVKRYVVFPGGVVPHAGHWYVVCGVDDTFSRVYRLPFADVEAALNATAPDTGEVTSIRDTAICTGTPAADRPRT